MKSNVLFAFGFVMLCAMILSLVYVQGAISHYNKKEVLDVVETCWLFGYPSRTKCDVKSFTETNITWSGNDHFLVLGPGNIVIPVHYPGHANHPHKTPPKRRVSRTRLVYDNCGECN